MESQSFSSWLVSTVFGYARESGFAPPDPALYSKLSSSLSLACMDQSRTAHSIAACLTLFRCKHFLKHCAPSISKDQKDGLVYTSPFAPSLCDPLVLFQVSSELEGAAATAHHLGVAKALADG